MLCSVALLAFALCAAAQGRAVNISNTWVLPEEGFPVFYRYFRDRISWYEADAVCQFHHANLVTVDTTAQYDAVRAYLKELDISSAVWVGLIRSNPDGDFTWTDYRGLGSDGYWSSAPDPRAAPLCAAADPAADYRWEARACGGPTVSSFICELPVPQWALGNEGCMVKALPALTILYLPESAAVQLNADCGLAGVKKVQCTGSVKREDLLRDLSCNEEDEISSTVSMGPTGATSTVTSENMFTDQDVNEATTEENTTTEHEDDINQSSTIKPTPLPYITNPPFTEKVKAIVDKPNKIYINKNVNLDVSYNNNLQSNDIPKLAGTDDFLSSGLSEKLEDEKHMQHKMLHDEFAKHGNFETIFTQPTDHFVPPLVMAKAKISDDMTVISIEEKHAQQLAEQRYSKHLHTQENILSSVTTEPKVNINKQNHVAVTDKPLITTVYSSTLKEDVKQNVVKTIVPKKYDDRFYGLKNKNLKVVEFKASKIEKTTVPYPIATTDSKLNDSETSKYLTTAYSDDQSEEDPTIDLTVIIKEPEQRNDENSHYNHSIEIPKIEIIQNDTSISEPEIKLISPKNSAGQIEQEISVKIPTKSSQNLTLTHDVIKITIVKEENSSEVPMVFEVTTKIPVFDIDNSGTSKPLKLDTKDQQTPSSSHTDIEVTTSSKIAPETTPQNIVTTLLRDLILSTSKPILDNTLIEKLTTKPDHPVSTVDSIHSTTLTNENITVDSGTNSEADTNATSDFSMKDIDDIETDSPDLLDSNTTDTSQTIDDFQSPLLSGANEPIHRPNRSRRPQPLPNRNKFNPFRILG